MRCFSSIKIKLSGISKKTAQRFNLTRLAGREMSKVLLCALMPCAVNANMYYEVSKDEFTGARTAQASVNSFFNKDSYLGLRCINGKYLSMDFVADKFLGLNGHNVNIMIKVDDNAPIEISNTKVYSNFNKGASASYSENVNNFEAFFNQIPYSSKVVYRVTGNGYKYDIDFRASLIHVPFFRVLDECGFDSTLYDNEDSLVFGDYTVIPNRKMMYYFHKIIIKETS